MKTIIDDDLDTILDAGPDEWELARRKMLIDKAFEGDVESIKTLKEEYNITYLKRGDKEIWL